ncbi:helix-turn-helix transcriptional regulator [Sinorhizobium sp. BG8]|uniref:AraC family transcriptional regulator n=1 Tax=Sinorhizobium sp. BG8 TaxID=2613773 RepID=UPI001FED6248|nr:helix-turn-helix transcriptional regulator [Sinorhizobium sp. BG8]
MPENATYPRHSHPWGELVYSYSGMMEISLNDGHYLAPPQYAVWLPPDVQHRGLNRQAAVHCSLYVDPSLCETLPKDTTALEVTPLLRSMLEHLRSEESPDHGSEERLRFLRVVVDLATGARRVGTYLPWSTDPQLETVLSALNENPADNRSLSEHARLVGTAERTLIRRSLRDLGMPFAEWKQRLRVTKAMPMLEEGATVETIAAVLGYSNASSFIAMFKRMTASTPDEYRSSVRGR